MTINLPHIFSVKSYVLSLVLFGIVYGKRNGEFFLIETLENLPFSVSFLDHIPHQQIGNSMSLTNHLP